jgi:3-phosphoshikimate 1-carboxyvinyltransferase
MQATIQPSIIKGTITAPASKSSMQRACAAALVKKGISNIYNYGISNDDKAALSIVKAFGAQVTNHQQYISINTAHINFNTAQQQFEINCGESGLSIRMFTPIAALCNTRVTVTGSGSLTTRPMNFFDEILPQVGVQVNSNQGKLPLQVTGALQPQNITIDGSLSSQFLTGLLMAYAASAIKEDTTITVDNLKSKPYIDLTLKVMEEFGLNVPINNQHQQFILKPNNQQNKSSTIHYTVEGDWSGGAFLLVAGAIAGNINVNGLDILSTQADKAIIKALIDCGCNISIQPTTIEIGTSTTGLAGLQPFRFNATDCPDLFPPLVALAAYCNGKTIIEGVSRLAHKESNRGITLQEEFGKMGIVIELDNDCMIVHGGTGVNGTAVHAHHDHRIAMACAVAALPANGTMVIDNADAISKSYPNFYEHLQQLGTTIFL